MTRVILIDKDYNLIRDDEGYNVNGIITWHPMETQDGIIYYKDFDNHLDFLECIAPMIGFDVKYAFCYMNIFYKPYDNTLYDKNGESIQADMYMGFFTNTFINCNDFYYDI
jgi:hypothetical protein